MLRIAGSHTRNQPHLASAEHMPDIYSDTETIASDTIRVQPPPPRHRAHAEHMPTPPSNQAQGLLRGQKRYYDQTQLEDQESDDNYDSRELENNIRALQQKLDKAKKRKRLLKEKERLERVLAGL